MMQSLFGLLMALLVGLIYLADDLFGPSAAGRVVHSPERAASPSPLRAKAHNIALSRSEVVMSTTLADQSDFVFTEIMR